MNKLRTRHNRDAWSAWHEKNRSPVESSTERGELAKGTENSSAVSSLLLPLGEPLGEHARKS